MSKTVSNRLEMLAGLTPSLQDGEYVFCFVEDNGSDWQNLQPLGIFREAEGITLILERDIAQANGLNASSPMRRIVLEVYSALEGIGLTAGVSSALSDAGIPCNMVAAFHHDHVFVPSEMAENALETLLRLQADAKAAAAKE